MQDLFDEGVAGDIGGGPAAAWSRTDNATVFGEAEPPAAVVAGLFWCGGGGGGGGDGPQVDFVELALRCGIAGSWGGVGRGWGGLERSGVFVIGCVLCV